MNTMNALEKQFYSEVKESIDYYLDLFVKSVTNPKADNLWMDDKEKIAYQHLQKINLSQKDIEAIRSVIHGICVGIVHSLFVSIDGGTALSDHGKALELIDKKINKSLTDGALHENFMEYF
ncbi:MAG: hypothetical protein WC659_07255 [Patescibacteria group bacterium]